MCAPGAHIFVCVHVYTCSRVHTSVFQLDTCLCSRRTRVCYQMNTRVCLCFCVHINVCAHVCSTHVCVCSFVHMCVFTSPTCTHVRVFTCTHMCVLIRHMFAFQENTRLLSDEHTGVCVHVYTCVCSTCTHMMCSRWTDVCSTANTLLCAR